ncbi:NAD(P)/FAD-dependent oxidoreductase [Thalassobacillus sp. CUG 92003]|uniref:NAD(P)/FAD-dependent oxidoreductase n=1 Tax=Thalassobacillus sp. CUG 92003 TaxID=2736641 RepID=UPI0015E7981D|nr:FAD-dependent oxidoreductase [Thalassobacillus sp. CUG 92003]
MNTTYDVLIVGAGMAGIMAGQELRRNECDNVMLLDKGSHVGGRLATKEIASGKADHGAQFFTVRSQPLQEQVEKWLHNSWVKHWFGEDYPRYTGVSGMNQLAYHLAENLPLSLNTEINHLEKRDDEYILKDVEGKVYHTKHLIFTLPVPQTLDLLDASALGISKDAYRSLEQLTFAPTYVGLFEFSQDTSLPEDGHLDKGLPDGVQRIVDHKKKGMSSVPIISVYMTADWSDEHEGRDNLLAEIETSVKSYFNWDDLQSRYLKLWRYAQAERVYKHPYMGLDEEATLLIAGDTFLYPDDQSGRTRFESAFLSGVAAGQKILEKY